MRKFLVSLIVIGSFLGIVGCAIWEVVNTVNACYSGTPHSWSPLLFLLVFFACIVLTGIFCKDTLDEMQKESQDKKWDEIRKKSGFHEKL